MTEEEYFRKHYPDVCYNGKPLSPYWDLFQDGVEFGERQSEKKIEELEKENTELKEKLEHRNCLDCSNHDSNIKLTKAKEIIKKFTEFINNEIEYDPEHPQEHTDKWNELCKQSEQFIKEIEK